MSTGILIFESEASYRLEANTNHPVCAWPRLTRSGQPAAGLLSLGERRDRVWSDYNDIHYVRLEAPFPEMQGFFSVSVKLGFICE